MSIARRPVGQHAVALACLLILAPVLPAQTFYGSILGTVTDASGAMVPGAAVSLINVGTSERRTAETDTAGNYRFVSLVPGAYKIDIEKSGFKRLTRDGIQVQVEAAVRIDAALQVGDVGQTVEVTGQTPLLQTDTSALGQVVEARKVQEMPLNGRNVLNLVALVPGVVPQGNAMQNPATGNNTGWGNYQIGGGQANQAAAFFDGGPVNVGYVSMVAMVPAQDTVMEFRVQTNNLSAEFGRFSGGVINLTSKSGTNGLHGSAYEFLRNKVLNANTFFNNRAGSPTPAFTQNQFGATGGGHIIKDKTFFFLGYEGFRVATGTPTLATVPTVAFRNGDFSNLRNAAGNLIPIYDPLTSCGVLGNPACASARTALRTVFPGNVIPANRLDKTAKILTGLWALPNTAGQPFTALQNFNVNTPNNNTTDQGNARIDENLSDKQRLFGRYTIWDLNRLPRDTFQTQTDGFTWQKSQQAVLADSYTFAPTVLGDFRFAFMRYNYDARSQTSGMDLSTIGWPASLNNQIGPYRSMPFPIVQGYPDVLTAAKTAVIASVNNSYTSSGSVTLIRKGHTLKIGGEWRILQWNFVQVNNPSGNLTFDSLFTSSNPQAPGSSGYGYASYMLGYGTGGSASNSSPTAGQQTYHALYLADSLQISRKLTLTLGLRWERPGPWTERWDRETVLLTDVTSPLAAPTGLRLKGMLALVNSKEWPSRYNQQPHNTLFAPRFGFAYRVSDKSVVRGGYGIFYPPNDSNLNSGPNGSPVNGITTPFTGTVNSSLTPYAVLSNPYPDGILQPPGHSPSYLGIVAGQNMNSPVPVQLYPYVQQWNLDVQREVIGGVLVDVGYAGAKGTHLWAFGQQLNQLPDQYLSLGTKLLSMVQNPFYGLVATGTLAQPTVQYGQLLRPFPQATGASATAQANRYSIYHSLQVKLEKRFHSGGAILGAYTFAKLLGNSDTLSTWLENNNGGVGGSQDNNNNRLERSVTSQDVPHRLVLSYVYDLPFGKGKAFLGAAGGVLNQLVSGWSVSGVGTYQSGFPLSLSTSNNLTNSFGGGSRPNLVAGCTPAVEGAAQDKVNRWFNTSCFTAPPAYTFGTVARTTPYARWHGQNNMDFSLVKSTRIHEQYSLQFRTEVFNLINRVQFGPPGTTLGNAQFGVVSTQQNNPRLIQFALRFAF